MKIYIAIFALGVINFNIPIQKDFGVCNDFQVALQHKDQVHTLFLRNNKEIRSLAGIKELRKLKSLNISGTNLEEIPEEISYCVNLEEIIGNNSNLKSIPASIGKLSMLKEINLSYNNITEIPVSISDCSNLEEISLGSNYIEKIPKGFGDLKKLWFCNLSYNRLSIFSSEFSMLDNIQNLWLHENDISKIDTNIVDLKNLTHLLIDSDEILNLNEIKEMRPDLRIISED